MGLLTSKKGSRHVEIIISFILFIGFVAFLFYAFNPFQNTLNFDFSDSVFIKMEEKVLTNISSVSINLNKVDFSSLPPGTNCLSLLNANSLISGLKCSSERDILVKDKNGNIMGATVNYQLNDKINIQLSNLPDNKDKSFYTIYCSSELKTTAINNPSCQQFLDSDYRVGLINYQELWSNKSLYNFELEYGNNYDVLKETTVPEGNDFSFTIFEFGGKKLYESTKKPTTAIGVISKSYPINVLNENANIMKYSNIIIIW